MKQDEDEPEFIFDPEVGRFVPPPERRPVSRGYLAAFLGGVGASRSVRSQEPCSPMGGGWPPSNADVWGFFGAIIGFFTGAALALLAWFIGRALRRGS